MTDAIRPLIAGNWKMNGLKSSLAEFEAMLAGASGVAAKADLLVCPPATLIADFAERARGATTLAVGAQDCHPKPSGAHTGDISAEMLADAGATRHHRRPFRAARRSRRDRRRWSGRRRKPSGAAGSTAIVCIGETQHQRDAGPNAGYLPRPAQRLAAGRRAAPTIWSWPMSRSGRSAPGLTPTAQDVEQIHGFIRELLICPI